MTRALERHNKGTARVIPVIIRPVDIQGAPFAHLQCLPRDAKPVSVWPDTDEAFVDIAKGIRRAIGKLRRPSAERQFRKEPSFREGLQTNPSLQLPSSHQPISAFAPSWPPVSRPKKGNNRWVWVIAVAVVSLLGSLILTFIFVKPPNQNTPSSRSHSCTDTIYVANVYPLSNLPASLNTDGWHDWLRLHRWIADYAPHIGDIMLLDDNTDGAGPGGAVGIVQYESGLGPHLWRIRMRTAGWPGEKPFVDAGCNNVADHTFGKIFDGLGGGVSYYYKVGVSR
ncbi:MAG: hypothetical protein JO125_06470 [Chloroflexi bacterium]|nr:hypothetical protein [Chloroflexota bacterium]